MKLLLLLLALKLISLPCEARDFTFTVVVEAGRSECFYDYIHKGAFLEIEYQVIEGGDLDINFVVSDPDRVAIVMEPRSMDGLHGLDIKKTGEYEICLDNSFSSFTEKLIFFDVIIEDDPGETEPEKEVVPYQLTTEAMVLDIKVQDIKSKLDNIGKNLTKIITTQNYFQARESRHRRTQDSNHSRVMWWSLLECSVIITVGVIQVVLIRNLFRTTRRDNIRT